MYVNLFSIFKDYNIYKYMFISWFKICVSIGIVLFCMWVGFFDVLNIVYCGVIILVFIFLIS